MNQAFNPIFLAIPLLAVLASCSGGKTIQKLTQTVSPSITPAAGEKTVTFKLFTDPVGALNPSGSFDAPIDANGTIPAPQYGFPALRYFGSDNTTVRSLAASPPGWITRFEVGLSGANNTKMTSANQYCAQFSSAVNTCNQPGGAGTFPCHAPAGANAYYRTSEYHCVGPTAATPTATGTGNSDDGIYLRAYFSSDPNALATNENILVTIEYLASGISTGEPDARKCLSANTYNPVKCSETVWSIYLKSGDKKADGTEWNPKPFFLLVPPVEHYSAIQGRKAESDSHFTRKQIIIPMASFRAAGTPITVFQLSRTGSKYSQADTPFGNACNPFTGSSQCVGVTFYTISFQRI